MIFWGFESLVVSHPFRKNSLGALDFNGEAATHRPRLGLENGAGDDLPPHFTNYPENPWPTIKCVRFSKRGSTTYDFNLMY